MSTSRLLSLFVVVIVVVAAVFTLGSAANANTSSAALDQSDRHPGFVNLSLATAGQAYMAYRRGEWNAGNSIAAFDVEQARLQWRAAK